MSKPDLDAIQKRADAATEGPWKSSDFGYPGDEEPSSIVIHQGAFNWKAIEDGEYLAALPAWDSQEGADAEFIANARTDVPALLAYARDLEARNKEAGAVALEEAADDASTAAPNDPTNRAAAGWLRARAAKIRAAIA